MGQAQISSLSQLDLYAEMTSLGSLLNLKTVVNEHVNEDALPKSAKRMKRVKP